MSDRVATLEERLAALRARLEEGLPERATALRAALERVSAGETPARDEVRRIAHKLRGIAGSHGYEALGESARELEAMAAAESTDASDLVARGLVLVAEIRRAGPSTIASAPNDRPRAVPTARLLAGRRVLAVDDDGPTRRLLDLTLTGMGGADARVLDGAEEALALIDRERFDVLIVDAMMPSITGLALAREARERIHGAGLAIVFLSAAMPDELGWTLPEGARWVPKPFRPRELLETLSVVLGTDAP